MSESPNEMSMARNGLPPLVFDLDGNFITEVISQIQFAKDNSLTVSAVNRVLQSRRSSTQGYILIFADEFTEEVLRDRLSKSRNRDFYVFDKTL